MVYKHNNAALDKKPFHTKLSMDNQIISHILLNQF